MAEEDYKAVVAAALALEPHGADVAVVEASSLGEFSVPAAVEKANQVGTAWVIEIPLVGAILSELAKSENVTVFAVSEVPDSIFATTEPLAPGKSFLLVEDGVIGTLTVAKPPKVVEGSSADTSVSKRVARLVKTAEERFVFGVVLVPEVKDSQGDIYSHEEVRNAAHVYMEKHQVLGKQHTEVVTGRLKVLESYVAPANFEIEGETITKGTWLIGIRVVDDELWKSVKEGSFTGFSIGGEAYRQPEVVAPPEQ